MCSFPGLPVVGSNTTVHITRVNLNPHTVLVEFGGSLNNGQENIEVYQHLKKDLDIPRKRQQHTFEGKPGEVCLVYEDRTWHRARILSKSEHEYKVFLIDDGKFLWVSSEVLTKCPQNLCSLPPKVELCILANVSALCLESAWSVDALNVIRSLSGKDISGCVQDVIMPSRIIILDIPSLSKQMYDLGFARNMSNGDFKSLVMHLQHLPRKNPSIQTDLVTTNSQEEHASDPDRLDQYLYPELLPGAVETVTVTQVINPLKIYCKLHVLSQELKKLSEQLQEYYEDSFAVQMPMLLYDGSPCATKGSEGKWYRSVLQQNNVSDVVKVFHVDYGIGDFVKLSNIRPLSARFFKLPVVTYACSLHGVIDKGIGWRTEQIEYLKSVVLDQILVGKFEHYSANESVYYITLYGNDSVNVNDTFGHREQCLSTTEKICGDRTLETLNKVAHKDMSGRNVPVHSLASTTLTKCSDSFEDVTVTRLSENGKNLQPAEVRPSSNVTAAPSFQNETYVVSPPKTEVGAEEKVQITCVQSVNQFYGHFTQNTETVMKMTIGIQQLCQNQPQAKFSIYPEMMCLAKYADGLWHRGQIESTHPKILVQFVDYGDVVVLEKSDILPLPPKASEIASIPIQAVQFELFNVTLPEQCELNEWFKNYATDCMFTAIVKQNSGKLSVEIYDEKTNLNSKIKEQWNETSKGKGFTLSKGMEKAHIFSKSAEGMESRGERHNFRTTSKAHKTSKKVPKPVVEDTLEQNFQTFTSHTTGHSRAKPIVLQQQVSSHYPKLTDLPPRALDAGLVSDIYVSHCNSPSSFFVQLASDEGEIFSLLDKLNSAPLSDAQVELDLLQSDDLVVAEYTADGAWYRAVVQDKKNGVVQVQFIDFGNEATLLPHKIRQLDKQFLSSPRFSIQCTLEDGRRGKRDWTQEEIMTFKKAAGEHGEKKIQCKFIQKDTSAWIVSLELELEERHLFDAVLKPGAQPESQMHCDECIQPFAFKEPAISQGQIVDAYASSIVGPNYFWCQFKNSEELDKISLLAQEIGNSSQTKPIRPDQLCQGPCLALFSDRLWYRAQVINTHSKTVSVHFIDYGNESEIDLIFVKPLPTKLLESPPQAFLCQLEVLGSADGMWSDAAADKFFELLVDEPLKVTILNTVMSSDLPNCSPYNVIVECNGLIVNDLMKDYWCDPKPQVCSKVTVGANIKPTASEHSFGIKSSETVQKDNAPKLNCGQVNNGASNDVNPDLHSFDPQISQNKLVAAETQEKSITYPTLTAVDGSMMVPELSVQCLPQAVDLPLRMIEPGKVSEVYVSHINSLTSFFVQLEEDENALFTLTELLNSHQQSEKDDIHASSVQQGSLVKAMFSEDDSWYRAVVKDMTQNGMIQVEFIDFGNEATVSLLKICRLDVPLLSYPRFGIHCSCNLDDQFKMQKGMEQMFLFNNIFGEAGENKLSCKFIKENGITWEVKITPSGNSSDSNEKLDSLDAKASPVVSKPVKDTFQLLFKKPEVSLGQTVEAFASCIVGPDYFWCQFSNSEILDQITLVAQEYGNSSGTQPIKVDKLDPGSLCLARFCDDQMWYRAQVINKWTNVVSVLFVDFGNESETSENSLKALPCDLLESPPQAFLCQLEGFDPSKGSWDSGATDNFYKLLVDKPLKVTVQCIDGNPPYYVKVESPQCLVNELMMKFWSGSAQNDQTSSEVIESIASTSDQQVSEDKMSVSLGISTEDMHTIEQHGADQIKPLIVKGDLLDVPEKKVDDQLDGADVIAVVTNTDVSADDPSRMDLEIHKVGHESDEGIPVVSTEQMLLHTEKRKDIDGSEKVGNPKTASRSIAGLENLILPMVFGFLFMLFLFFGMWGFFF
ncbi:tudor domain-containing 6 isoform X1 [Carassius gibelio]|uniref:tudor domain-containing 6 isoform X1 n=1 Tax=Carassius gibelio TaxID=101364 RepID=UPI002277F22C|nr:tudor domain-containing 6 isoform X1 [Carassius gibelio]